MTGTIRWRLSPPTRKALLLIHIAAAGAWLGMDLVLGILVVTAFTAPATPAAAAAVSIAAFTTWPLAGVGLITLATGIVLGLGSKYGLTRYWWVLVKLALNIVLVGLVLVLLAPGVSELRDIGLNTLGSGATDDPAVPVTMMFPPIVSSTAVIAAMTLSVFKPWGRTRPLRSVGGMTRHDRPTPARQPGTVAG